MPLALVNTSLPATYSSCKRVVGFGNNSSAVSLKTARVWQVMPYSSAGRTAKHCIKALVNPDGAFKKEEDARVLANVELEDLSSHKPHNIFPPNFVFGAASAAFQVEGATKDGGRGPSIWDTFCEKFPEKIADQSSGDPASGSYYHYKEDVQLLADIGLKAYRFSISWSRVLPKGRGTPNEEGIAYYNKLINELLHNGIQPHVTLFHWDLPQALEDEYGGFLSRKVIEDYKNYVNLCFERFGDRVKHWITLNEPYSFSHFGYNDGSQAPGHCTPDLEVGGKKYVCPQGDSLREPYTVAHNLLLAHAEAVSLYREKFKDKFGGQVGVTLVTHWFEPYDNHPANKEAQHRAIESVLGWFFDPIKYGNYPFSMRALVGERLPIFTPEESIKLKDSFDFVGINYYSARYARDQPDFNYTVKTKCSNDDSWAEWIVDKGNVPIGPAEENSWINVYPKGLRKLLLYIKDRYRNPPIYITENGVYSSISAGQNLKASSIPAPIDDIFRTEFHTSHLHELENALSSQANVRGYFVWSLLDSFEWDGGYTCRFGLNQIDFKNPDLPRRPKQSSLWLKRFLKNVGQQPSDQIKPLPDAIETIIRQVPATIN